jgi:hypothetical protein
MTISAVVNTANADSAEAGSSLGQQISAAFKGLQPDVVILFASPRHDYSALLRALDDACSPRILVGASSAGEFTSATQGEGLACAIALGNPEMQFALGVGRNLSKDRKQAAADVASAFNGITQQRFAYRTALVLADALAGHAEELVDLLTLETGGSYSLFGGGAGGDENFEKRFVFAGTEAIPDGVVALEILSHKPIGVGVRHGWQPKSAPLRVTEAEGMRLGSLNAAPAAEVFADHAAATKQPFDRKQPLPFFLHNILGVDTGRGHKLRVPLAVNEDGSVAVATEVPPGATATIMCVTNDSAAQAAADSTRAALEQLGSHKPAVALFFDCVATRLRMGREFGFELKAVQEVLGATRFAGCNTIGQIARVEGQFSGFHNCTAVVCVIPD